MSTRPSRSFRLPFLPALVLLVLVAGFAATATAQTEIGALSVSPSPPTWEDRVEVRLAGESSCTLSVDELRRPDFHTLELVLGGNCLSVLPPPSPFSLTTTLPRLAPDVYQLRVTWGGEVLAETELEVWRDASFQVLPPEGPATDAEPLVVTLHGWGLCAGPPTEDRLQVLGVADGVAELYFNRECYFVSPFGMVQLPVDLGVVPAGDWEIRLFVGNGPLPNASELARGTVRVHDADACVPGDTTLCLGDGNRFRVEVEWEDFQGNTGAGRAIPLAGRQDTGGFWFFRASNLELTLKVLDGCGVNGHYWVFVSSGSTVGYRITVTDTRADATAPAETTRSYENPLGATPALVADTAAFAHCDLEVR